MVLDYRLRPVVNCLPGSRPLVCGTLELLKVPEKPSTSMAGPKICAFPCQHRLFLPPPIRSPALMAPTAGRMTMVSIGRSPDANRC